MPCRGQVQRRDLRHGFLAGQPQRLYLPVCALDLYRLQGLVDLLLDLLQQLSLGLRGGALLDFLHQLFQRDQLLPGPQVDLRQHRHADAVNGRIPDHLQGVRHDLSQQLHGLELFLGRLQQFLGFGD